MLSKRGDICVIERVSPYSDLDVRYYETSEIICSSPEWFRIIDLNILMRKGKK